MEFSVQTNLNALVRCRLSQKYEIAREYQWLYALCTSKDYPTFDTGLGTRSPTIFAESKQRGIPPPGCTEPPQKYSFLMALVKLGCLKKAANLSLLAAPYKAPRYELVLFSIPTGSGYRNISIGPIACVLPLRLRTRGRALSALWHI